MRSPNGTDSIYVINADGSGASQVASQGLAPSWSPDGRIVYQSLKSDMLGIAVRRTDGSLGYPSSSYQVHPEDASPSWSPDGSRIVFASNQAGDKLWRIYFMNADGSGSGPIMGLNGKYPAWGPGGLVAFRRVYTQEGLYVMTPQGAGLRQIANVGNDTAPAWSPDGQRVAFMADRDSNGGWEIYVVNQDGSGVANVTNSPESIDVLPAWLPDGKHIAFRSNRGGSWGLWIMHDDGSGVARIAQAEMDMNRYLEDRMSAQ